MIRDYENDRKEDKIFFVLTGFNWKRGGKKEKKRKGIWLVDLEIENKSENM